MGAQRQLYHVDEFSYGQHMTPNGKASMEYIDFGWSQKKLGIDDKCVGCSEKITV